MKLKKPIAKLKHNEIHIASKCRRRTELSMPAPNVLKPTIRKTAKKRK